MNPATHDYIKCMVDRSVMIDEGSVSRKIEALRQEMEVLKKSMSPQDHRVVEAMWMLLEMVDGSSNAGQCISTAMHEYDA